MHDEKQPDSRSDTVFLVVVQERDDFDIIYGIFTSRERAQAAKDSGIGLLISCADIFEIKLNELRNGCR